MQINVHDLAHSKGVPTAAREAMLLMQERIAELEAENGRLKNLVKQNNNLAKMYKQQADEFRAKYVTAAGGPD